jgi:archaemetzincin
MNPAICVTSVGPVEDSILTAIAAWLAEQFWTTTERMGALKMPETAWDATRRQHNSVPILRRVAEFCPPDAFRLLAVTQADLFIPMLTFVYGQAQMPGRVAMISLARLRQEFYGLEPNSPLLLSRAMKESLHELGHTFGLVHCPDRSCAMALSTNIRQLDLKNGEYCGACSVLVRDSRERTSPRATAQMKLI